MQTTIYKKEIFNLLKKTTSAKVLKTDYDFLLESKYIDVEGRPLEELIFLEFKDFKSCIDNFFNKLEDFIDSEFNGFHSSAILIDKDYLINLFKLAPFTMEANRIKCIQKIIKIPYEHLESTNNTTNYQLTMKINKIKDFYIKKHIFLYEKIRDSFGAKLQKENNIFLCPYCQRNYVNIITDDSLTIKPDLDHFYPKSKYPFLASCITNLIPSCQVCNSRLKGEKDFYLEEHSNPLELNGKCFDNLKFNYLDDETIYIEDKQDLKVKELNYINTFKIEEVYRSHIEILEEILDKDKKYNNIKKKHLHKTCPILGHSDLKNLIFSEYYNINITKVPMSKMKNDLFKKIVK